MASIDKWRQQFDLFDSEPPSMRPADDLMPFMTAIRPHIDRTIASLARARFCEDPICGPVYSRIPSIVGSAQKRHGRILELALREGLRASNRHRIWTESKFAVSVAAENLISTQSEEDCWRSDLPYGEAYRFIQIDFGVDTDEQNIAAYELKRANGLHDSGKIRSMRRDLCCQRLLLKSYGHRLRSFSPNEADAKIIFYYGKRSIPPPYSLIGAELDDHFGFAIISRIEAANDYYRDLLHDLLKGL
jgi:hypothetical protein